MLEEIPELKNAKKAIKKAQELMIHKEGLESADLVIENERLKTSIMILNQKLKSE